MPLLELEILKRPEHLSSPPVFCRFPVAPSLVFRIVFFEELFVFSSFFSLAAGLLDCLICLFLIYGF